MSPLEPPRGGSPPPESATLPDGRVLELRPAAREICRRYRLRFPDEAERYGDAGIEWCVHDNQHILSWAALELAHGGGLLERQVGWLASVLSARDFPLDRLRENLAIASQVVAEEHGAPDVARLLDGARSFVPD